LSAIPTFVLESLRRASAFSRRRVGAARLLAMSILALACAAPAGAQPSAQDLPAAARSTVTALWVEEGLEAVPRSPVQRDALDGSVAPSPPRRRAPAPPDALRQQFESFLLQRDFEEFLRSTQRDRR
jgi:hypothetical protein